METSGFHKHIALKFAEYTQCKYKNILKYSEAMIILSYARVPKHLRYNFLKEMEQLGYIKFHDRRHIEIFVKYERPNVAELRKQGYSVREIVNKYGIPKNKVNQWLHESS